MSKSDFVILGTFVFGGLGVPVGCLVSPTMGTSIVPRPGLAFLVTVFGFALFGAVFGLIAGLAKGPPGPPTDQSDRTEP